MLGALSNDQVFTPNTNPSWEDIGKKLALDAGRDLLGAVAGKVSSAFGGSTSTPQSAAALEAARQAQARAEEQKMLMIAAGVLGAVVLGALVLRR